MLTLHLDKGKCITHLCIGSANDPPMTWVGRVMLVYTILMVDDKFSYEVSKYNCNSDRFYWVQEWITCIFNEFRWSSWSYILSVVLHSLPLDITSNRVLLLSNFSTLWSLRYLDSNAWCPWFLAITTWSISNLVSFLGLQGLESSLPVMHVFQVSYMGLPQIVRFI